MSNTSRIFDPFSFKQRQREIPFCVSYYGIKYFLVGTYSPLGSLIGFCCCWSSDFSSLYSSEKSNHKCSSAERRGGYSYQLSIPLLFTDRFLSNLKKMKSWRRLNNNSLIWLKSYMLYWNEWSLLLCYSIIVIVTSICGFVSVVYINNWAMMDCKIQLLRWWGWNQKLQQLVVWKLTFSPMRK